MTAAVALGSNLGDRAATLDAAVARLSETAGVMDVRVSRYHETVAEGMAEADAPPFLNAAAVMRCSLPPEELLACLLRIERELGRVRPASAQDPAGRLSRTLDLDLVLYGSAVLTGPGLVVPHPRMHLRRFVLEPLAEVGGGLVHPIFGVTVSELLRKLAG